MKNLGELRNYLGVPLDQFRNVLYLYQAAYCTRYFEEILNEFGSIGPNKDD